MESEEQLEAPPNPSVAALQLNSSAETMSPPQSISPLLPFAFDTLFGHNMTKALETSTAQEVLIWQDFFDPTIPLAGMLSHESFPETENTLSDLFF